MARGRTERRIGTARWRWCAALALLAGLLASWLPLAGVARAAAPTTLTFGYTGAAQTWTVPADVTSVTFDVYGAQGGSITSFTSGGHGGRATATLAVTPGATVVLTVGGQGAGTSGACGNGAAGQPGGFNGGGVGGAGFICGAGGGGASDVRLGGGALADRALVAGGGGGAANSGGQCDVADGGAGGGAAGGDGTSAMCGANAPGGGQVAGSGSGQLGAGGAGTAGGATFDDQGSGGGGGGGGYYGGAGGGQYTGGGGGSGYGPVDSTFVSGARAGDGQIVVTYAPIISPTLASASPATLPAGSADTILTLTGADFDTTSVAYLAGTALDTTYTSPTQLTATVRAAQLAAAGQYPLSVVTSGFGTSNPLTLTVTNPAPTLTGLNPGGVTAGAGDTPLTLSGSAFAPGATVDFGGTTLTPDPASATATSLTVTVPTALLVDARTVAVTVANPGPGGGTSAPQAFTVAPVPAPPAQASVAPASIAFDNRQVGTASDSQQVTVTNGGGSPLTIGGVTLSGANPGDFAVTFTTCVGNVPAGGSCVVGVRFAPMTAGTRAATLSIADNAAGSPQAVGLSGTGTTPPASPAPQSVVTASASGNGTITPAGSTSYTTGGQATYAAVPAAGQVFLGWTLDGQYVGYASPLTVTVNADRTLVATFAARPTFSDVPTSDPDYQAITTLAALGIINPAGVNGSGQFQPSRDVARAEVAAFLARTFGWEREFHGNPFPDKCDPSGAQGCVDDRLWNDVAALRDYGVVGGYTDAATCQAGGTTAPCYLPRESVLKVQVGSIVARAFTKAPDLRPTGFWDRLAANASQYTNVPDAGSQRSDLTTYRANAGAIPGQASDGTFPAPIDPASRRFVIEVLWQAYSAQFGTDRVP
jgi:hypothetical protein